MPKDPLLQIQMNFRIHSNVCKLGMSDTYNNNIKCSENADL